jgi:hypothetical protein
MTFTQVALIDRNAIGDKLHALKQIKNKILKFLIQITVEIEEG